MSRLLLEIYPEHRPGVDGGGDLPAVLISTRGDEGAFATEGPGGPMVVLRLQNGGCVLQSPPAHPNQPLGLGQWHEADGWRVRVTNAMPTNANMSVADNPSWAAPEIRITTYDGDRVKRLRCMLPVEEGSQLVLGRGGPGADLIVEDEHVSRVHMRFFLKDGRRMVEDMGSRWGTRLNGGPLTDPMPLKHGDEIRLGKTTIHYICYWDLLPQNQQGGPPVSMDAGLGAAAAGPDNGEGLIAEGAAAAVGSKARAEEAVNPPPPTAPPSPPPEVKPPAPRKGAKAKASATPTPRKTAPKPHRRNYWGFDVGGAILIVLLLLAGMVYLAWLVFSH